MNYSPELDGTVENSSMEKGVICQWFEGRLAGSEGSCVQQYPEQQQCSARADWAVSGCGCTMTFSVLSVRLAVSRMQVPTGLGCLLGCDWGALGEGRLSQARGVPRAVVTA